MNILMFSQYRTEAYKSIKGKMKKGFSICFKMFIIALLIIGCEKTEELKKSPLIETLPINKITYTSVYCLGELISDENDSIEKGFCWSKKDVPTINDYKISCKSASKVFSGKITGLEPNSLYNLRAYAINITGTAYGGLIKFKTKSFGTMIDQDGNEYKTMTIGSQTWMAENLRATKYNDGTSITNVSDDKDWAELNTGAYCSYNNITNIDSIKTFGILYNWYAASTGKLAPKGWHVATFQDFLALKDSLGGDIQAYKLEEYGFNAIPGGFRNTWGEFEAIKNSGYWWSSTSNNNYYSWGLCFLGEIESSKLRGYSIRCVKD